MCVRSVPDWGSDLAVCALCFYVDFAKSLGFGVACGVWILAGISADPSWWRERAL